MTEVTTHESTVSKGLQVLGTLAKDKRVWAAVVALAAVTGHTVAPEFAEAFTSLAGALVDALQGSAG